MFGQSNLRYVNVGFISFALPSSLFSTMSIQNAQNSQKESPGSCPVYRGANPLPAYRLNGCWQGHQKLSVFGWSKDPYGLILKTMMGQKVDFYHFDRTELLR